MKKVLLLAIVVVTATALYNQITPDYVKINREMVRQCTIDMQANPDLVCD